MPNPADCRFSESHEWFCADGDVVTMGLTAFAVDELTDLTYVDLKPSGTRLEAGDTIGEVESVKTTSDVYTSVGGEIVEVNQAAIDDPSIINGDAYGNGWLVKIRSDDVGALESLMDQSAYDAKHPVS